MKSPDSLPPASPPPGEDPLRPHTYDGIQEYDKRLPNWWLLTFYATIVFWIGYWMYSQQLAANAAFDDASLWKMSRNAVFVDAGRATFNATCASCHHATLTGGIGPSLVDAVWVHGGQPTQMLKVVNEGVLTKGMPAWGPILGPKKVSEVLAFILSHHTPPADVALAAK